MGGGGGKRTPWTPGKGKDVSSMGGGGTPNTPTTTMAYVRLGTAGDLLFT